MDSNKINMDSFRKPPWKNKNPKSAKDKTLLKPKFKAKARLRALQAGRKYPNLIDNMWAVAEQKKESKK